MANETATATAKANWEAARDVWEKAGTDRLERWLTAAKALDHLDHAVNIAEDAMTEAHKEWCRIEKAARIEAFLSAENAKINLNF